MIKPITHSILELRKPCLPIEKGENILPILNDLMETLATVKGYALAGNQIRYFKQIAYIKALDYKGQHYPEMVLINPKITAKAQKIVYSESCLSFPGLTIQTQRYLFIWLQNTNIKGEIQEPVMYQDLMAIIIQHECMHINSKILMDFSYRKLR